MSRRDSPRTRGGFWRITAICVAVALGAIAVYLVAFSTTAKQSSIGILLGAWAVFLAAPVMFGGRRAQLHAAQLRDAQAHATSLYEAQLQISQLQEAQLQATREVRASQELELRRFGEVQLAREVAARREADFRLERALRGEIERVLTEQLGSLRQEVTSLRAEVVDKLGGQLRLERIETTRVIASDLEALQNEIRRLGGSQESLAAPAHHFSQTTQTSHSASIPHVAGPAAGRPPRVPSPAPAEAASAAAGHLTTPLPAADDDIVDAEVIDVAEDARQPAQHPEPQKPSAVPTAPSAAPRAPRLAPAAAPPTAPAPPAAVVPPPERPLADMSRDPFAGLPRLTPLPDDLADLLDSPPTPRAQTEAAVETTSEPAAETAAPDAEVSPAAGAAEADESGGNGAPDTGDRSSGRRRAPEAALPADEPRYVGRRRASAAEQAEAAAESSGRRRAPDDASEDLMARLHGL
ncbi:MAG: hypothetical protein QOE71_1051 [Pseudonocardiales bacterium]|nr:hypothetical protein [Pseudonocardiales bacterium]